jgi:hypothetical protein
LDSFNVHELFDVIRSKWIEECESMPWCNLQGFCAIHNAKRIPKPTNIRAIEKKRADTLYKHKIVTGDISIPSKRPAPPVESELVQVFIGEFVTDGVLGVLKRRRLGKEREVPTLAEIASAASLPRPLALAVPEGPSIEAEEEPPFLPDINVSCVLGTDLPRVVDPDVPFTSWCYEWERRTRQTYLVRNSVIDLRKTDFFSRRVMISRKRTRNLGDLFNAWKHSINQLPEEQTVDITASDVDDFN